MSLRLKQSGCRSVPEPRHTRHRRSRWTVNFHTCRRTQGARRALAGTHVRGGVIITAAESAQDGGLTVLVKEGSERSVDP